MFPSRPRISTCHGAQTQTLTPGCETQWRLHRIFKSLSPSLSRLTSMERTEQDPWQPLNCWDHRRKTRKNFFKKMVTSPKKDTRTGNSLLSSVMTTLPEPKTTEKRSLKYVCLTQPKWSRCSDKLTSGSALPESFTFQKSGCRRDGSCHHSHPHALLTPSLQESHYDWCVHRGKNT